MYDDIWKYDSNMDKFHDNYPLNKDKLVAMIKSDMQNYANKLPKLKELEQKLTDMYFPRTI